MVYVEIGATFLTTFFGAFLAFGLENYRQRRRTTAWVRRHLADLRRLLAAEVDNADVVDGLIQSQIDACTAWLDAEQPLTDEQWELVGSVVNVSAPDFGAILRSEAITAVPTDVALALAQTEYGGGLLEHVVGEVHAAHRDVLPLWYDRVVPLAVADRRRVQRFRETLVATAGQVRDVRTPLRAVVTATGAWLG